MPSAVRFRAVLGMLEPSFMSEMKVCLADQAKFGKVLRRAWLKLRCSPRGLSILRSGSRSNCTW